MQITNKKILLTGASSGIGKSIAYKLAEEKCTLILIARRIELLNEIKKDLEHSGAKVFAYKCNVGNKDEVKSAYKKIKKDAGEIDIAIFSAGTGHRMTADEYDSELAEDIFGANFFGMIYFIEQLLPGFLKRKSGIIAGVSSMADNKGYSGSGFYCASKAGTTIYLEGLRIELKSHGVKVIIIKPGFVKTPMTDKNDFPMPFMISAEKAAKIIVKGIKKEKRIIQFPLRMVMLTKLIGLLPGRLYEFFSVMFDKHFKK